MSPSCKHDAVRLLWDDHTWQCIACTATWNAHVELPPGRMVEMVHPDGTVIRADAFMECPTCAARMTARWRSTTLCPSCQHNRALIARLKAAAPQEESKCAICGHTYCPYCSPTGCTACDRREQRLLALKDVRALFNVTPSKDPITTFKRQLNLLIEEAEHALREGIDE